jgi:predicted ATP-grasp superfamily ATP-dependent carboligase
MLPVLIFSGYNSRAIISFCRYANEVNIPFYIVAINHDDPILLTEYKKNIIKVRESSHLSVDEICSLARLIQEEGKFSKVFILPTSEYLNRFLLKHQLLFFDNNIHFGLCDKMIYELISDKFSFGKICVENKINIPEEFDTRPNYYPFVIKPKKYFTSDLKVSDKPSIITNKIDFEDYMQGKDIEDYYYQTYVEGKSYYLLYYITKSQTYSVFSHENLIQQPDGGSMILCRSTRIHENSISKQFAELLINLGFNGLIMIEVKLFEGEFYMIEANPRIWGPSQLILDSGMNLWDYFALENGLINNLPERNYSEGKWYFWSAGFSNLKKSVVTYDININDFFMEYSKILNSEIYLREDTINIYNIENNLLK